MTAKLPAALALLAAPMILALALCTLGGVSSSVASANTSAPLCATSGPLAGMTDAAAANTRIVAARAEQRGGDAAAVIAVTVGLTESGMLVLGNSDVDTGGLATQGNGADHDSLGIFQQRASWGTAAQRLDPLSSTDLFLDRLLDDVDWQTKPVATAAQDVQVSAFDGKPRAANHYSAAYGANYAANVDRAQALVGLIHRDASKLTCGAQAPGADSAQTATHGLPATYVIPTDATAQESAVISYAIAQLDKPYVFGAAGPSGFDCSGLALAAWAMVGVRLPHSTLEQATAGTPTTLAVLKPGDLVLVAGEGGTVAAPDHIGLYLGDRLVINAADEQIGVRVQPLDDFIRVGHGLSALRHLL